MKVQSVTFAWIYLACKAKREDGKLRFASCRELLKNLLCSCLLHSTEPRTRCIGKISLRELTRFTSVVCVNKPEWQRPASQYCCLLSSRQTLLSHVDVRNSRFLQLCHNSHHQVRSNCHTHSHHGTALFATP